ncbi:RNA polymerase subunit sigma-70 [Winogradskyella immobilis]|uniref:Anti-sigma factor n=1 Tax=Winogradskyella immobilis TaxID=2816852 RepID=A0ABS8ELK2_9FLAO|nr:RNA polymerase subunit sigma-70 [Winogradskyella immobilis]MCC1483975.1 anti-sigma factor [Winogradskyella immobilis]MCG0016067.1 RNA polymerase subunit sigma-70 [Winogradskyella immobilis]
MEEKLHTFLQSGLLEKYLVGDTSIAENLEVEHYIESYKEVSDAYNKLQTNLEIVAKTNAVEAPLGVLNNVLEATKKDPKVIVIPQHKTSWYSIAATITAFLFAGSSLYLYLKNQDLNSENQVVIEEIYDLRSDIDQNNSQLSKLSSELNKLNNPDTQKYVLNGNERAKDLKTVAYINPIDKTSMIDVISLPKLPEEQYYQIRAEFEDKMVSLGYLDDSERRLRSIPYLEDALALSITIANKNGESSLEDKEVAEISLKGDN